MLGRMLAPTPPDKLVDDQGRPYFLWDCQVTLAELLRYLASADAAERAYWTAKVMRQAKPDDAMTLIPVASMRDQWVRLEPFLGRTRPFWTFILDRLAP